MSNSKSLITYKIVLTPLDQFFFGGETVFGENGTDSRRRSYLVHSNILPQQTTLLGMLREQLLRQNNLLIHSSSTEQEIEKAINLVGITGFKEDQNVKSYGVIHEISPIVIEDDQSSRWVPSPLDDVENLAFHYDTYTECGILNNYKAKNPLFSGFTNGKQRKSTDSFFAESKQVGIKMTNRIAQNNDDDKDVDNAFYWQSFKRNGKTAFPTKKEVDKTLYSFCFLVKMDASISEVKFEDAHVFLGGERSAFSMRVEKQEEEVSFENGFHAVEKLYVHATKSADFDTDFKRVVLLSDCYADWNTIKENSALVVGNTVPFRYFNSYLSKNTRFYNVQNNKDNPIAKVQSNGHTLLERGSVIYCKNDQYAAITNELSSYPSFTKIGYNYYKTA